MLSYEDGLFRGLYMDGGAVLAQFARIGKFARPRPSSVEVTGYGAYVLLDGVAVRAA